MTEFNWVKVRSECSLASIFEKLKMELKADVESRQALLKGPPFDRTFTFVARGDGKVASVVVEGYQIYDSRLFQLTATAIEVLDKENKLLIRATPTLNDEGECRLKINEQERELWHLQKMALEPLFFPIK